MFYQHGFIPSLSLPSPLPPSPPLQCVITKSSVLVCWLGHESLQAQCLKLVTDLWSHGVAADLIYETQDLDSMEEIQVPIYIYTVEPSV